MIVVLLVATLLMLIPPIRSAVTAVFMLGCAWWLLSQWGLL